MDQASWMVSRKVIRIWGPPVFLGTLLTHNKFPGPKSGMLKTTSTMGFLAVFSAKTIQVK